MVRANGLIILPEEATVVQKGSKVTVQLLGRLSGEDADARILTVLPL